MSTVVVLGACLLASHHAPAQQARATSLPPSPEYAVASIRLNNTATDGHAHLYTPPENASFRAVNVTLLTLIHFAFDLPETQVLSAPAWAHSDKFDLDAKADPAVDQAFSKMSQEDSRFGKRHMLRTVLQDRFHLVSHLETRQLPEYALVVTKEGSRLQPSQHDGRSIGIGRNHLNAEGITAPILAELLAQILSQIVVDDTSLTGRYDLKLNWAPDDPATETSAPSFFTAVQEQLGLRLQSRKGPVQVLVIDHIEQPTEN